MTTISNPQATTDYTLLGVLTVGGCDTNGFSLTEWITAVVDNNTYPAPSVVFPLTVATGIITGTFVFPNLVANTLTPGDQVVFVCNKYIGKYLYTVYLLKILGIFNSSMRVSILSLLLATKPSVPPRQRKYSCTTRASG